MCDVIKYLEIKIELIKLAFFSLVIRYESVNHSDLSLYIETVKKLLFKNIYQDSNSTSIIGDGLKFCIIGAGFKY